LIAMIRLTSTALCLAAGLLAGCASAPSQDAGPVAIATADEAFLRERVTWLTDPARPGDGGWEALWTRATGLPSPFGPPEAAAFLASDPLAGFDSPAGALNALIGDVVRLNGRLALYLDRAGPVVRRDVQRLAGPADPAALSSARANAVALEEARAGAAAYRDAFRAMAVAFARAQGPLDGMGHLERELAALDDHVMALQAMAGRQRAALADGPDSFLES
jgi:hypothetical protein